MGLPRTRAQVHSKIDNLTQTYRKHERDLTTGSSPPTWPYFNEIKRFIGCLPINDSSLMEESCCNSSSDTVEKLISDMESGLTSDMTDSEGTSVPGTPTEEPPPPSPTVQSAVSLETSTVARKTRKRRRTMTTATEIQGAILAEQRMLREQLERAQETEFELRSKHLQLQEKLVNAVVGFFNKT
ncbi:uncharacterized protein [Dermacentor andersoni]|uniref:uncharacterized protein n=1 Tax=Dermacentor andersoni TaxID=34620 RepID=UPI002155F1DD|nr:uncharacterized protein LOC126531852 [Dermacentor andersoni]XP_054927540.1 uncharacterized protein LOC126531852 [Dermacentor andersoni]XP_054927541.1 uncharacterized protein LOC126531852 [Dermacentor andersoni]